MIVVGSRFIAGSFFCFGKMINERVWALSDIYVRISDNCKNPHIESIFYRSSLGENVGPVQLID